MRLPVISLGARASMANNAAEFRRPVEQAGQDIHAALEISGFFYVCDHGIAEATVRTVIDASMGFFSLPDAEKRLIGIDQHNRGYLGIGEAKMRGATHTDLKEVFFFGRELQPSDPDILAGRPLCAMNRWPDRPQVFRDSVLTYLAEVSHLGSHLLRCIALSLGAPQDFFTPYYKRPMARGQLIHYPAPETSEKADHGVIETNQPFGVAEHTDFGCITMLHQASPGLEVLNRRGEWIEVPPIDGALVVNVGDLLERWTAGGAPSTRHRVRNRTGSSRFSIAVFYDPSPDAVVNSQDLTGQSPPYPPIKAADYILQCSQGVFAQFKQNERPVGR